MADETTSGLGNMTELLQKQNETIAAVDESKKAQLRAAVLSKSSIEKDLSTGGLDNKLFAEKSKEYSDLNEIVGSAKDYISFQTEKEEL